MRERRTALWRGLTYALALLVCGMALATRALAQTSVDIAAPGPDGPLAGTFVEGGKKGEPVVLILAGSGPIDRDGNSPPGLRAAPYRLLAEGLAQHGIASVRIDKRGIGGSRSAVRDITATTIEDYAHDTLTWIDVIRHRTGARCVWVLGHSEGGLIALRTAKPGDSICGLILVAAAGRPLGEVIKTQLRANPGNAPLLDPATAIIDSLAAGRRVDGSAVTPVLMPLFRPAVQGLLISEMALDPVKLLGEIRKPVLILQGDKDLQIGVADAQRLKAAAPQAELTLLPDVNHVLKVVSGSTAAANIATYADPSLPLAPGIVDRVAEFVIKAHGLKKD